ncbi:ROK family transcriptional regulator [Pseudarthrobacter sp. J64]|uniref:ROK family transcriptional regulator n=1 Tax=Pseudarthrobacter sp. J64 TaxID=3116485 RepID=UPI002E819B9A|nr:ROK family transcriptional regulator [Pseudarthrobacter sp. J64]MEE2568578.1 ROK family transcriptional regulator [Pseudarthrobacter sp. J64]
MTAPQVVGADAVIHSNLSRVLGMLHRDGPLSRAQLTRQSGLNRSTVGALVSELSGLGLAYETEPPAVGRAGRPSPLVHVNEKVAALTINPDVDAVTVGLVGLGGRVHRRIRYEAATRPSVKETVNISRAIIDGMQGELDGMDRIVGIGAAVPGLVRSSDGSVLLAPHLEWSDEPFALVLEDALGLPARAGNDATLGCLAESIYGAAVGVSDALYLNGSASGIGGGVISGGRPLRGAAGFAGELGHTLVKSDGGTCHCGRSGCLDAEVRLERLLEPLGLKSADQEELEQAMAERPTPELLREIQRQIDLLAVALTNLVNIFNPDMIVLGGFLGALYSQDPDRLASAVAAGTIGGLGAGVRIRRAVLGSELLLVGAAELAFAALLANPAGT